MSKRVYANLNSNREIVRATATSVPRDPAELEHAAHVTGTARCSDAERTAARDRVDTARREGRLDTPTADKRNAMILSAVTRRQLECLVSDLPGTCAPPPHPPWKGPLAAAAVSFFTVVFLTVFGDEMLAKSPGWINQGRGADAGVMSAMVFSSIGGAVVALAIVIGFFAYTADWTERARRRRW